MWIFHHNYFPQKNVCCKTKKKLSENSFQFVIRKINTDFSSATSLINCGGKRLWIITVEKGCVVCKTASKEAQSLSAFQVGSWHIKIFLLQFSCNRPLETFSSCGKYQGFSSHPHPKQTIFQPTDTFSEVSFSRIQVPNSRPWNLSKTTQISICSLCLYHTLYIWIYANNFILNTHFWYSGNWSTKKNLLQYPETSFTLRATIRLHRTTFNKNKM